MAVYGVGVIRIRVVIPGEYGRCFFDTRRGFLDSLVRFRIDHINGKLRYRAQYIGNENVAVAKTMDKPCNNELLIYAFFTRDRIAKWDGS